MSINLNKIAKEITLEEGLSESMNIGQIKEVLRIIFTKYDLLTVVRIWLKYNVQPSK